MYISNCREINPTLLTVTLMLLVFFAGCGRQSSPTPPVRAAHTDTDTAKEKTGGLRVQLFNGEGEPPSMFIVINEEDQPITDFELTTYPPPLQPGNILLPEKSYFAALSNIEKGGSLQVLAADLKNAKGERLSDSKVKVGVVHLKGKVAGVSKGAMMDLTAQTPIEP